MLTFTRNFHGWHRLFQTHTCYHHKSVLYKGLYCLNIAWFSFLCGPILWGFSHYWFSSVFLISQIRSKINIYLLQYHFQKMDQTTRSWRNQGWETLSMLGDFLSCHSHQMQSVVGLADVDGATWSKICCYVQKMYCYVVAACSVLI